MKTGELAQAAQTQVEAILYYERQRLLPQAPRNEGNYRIYGRQHVDLLAFVHHGRTMDVMLDEIRVLLRFKDEPQAEYGAGNALLDAHIGHVATRIRELRQLEKQLKALRDQCGGVHEAAHYGILNELVQAPSPTGLRSASAHLSLAHGHRGGRRGQVSTSNDRSLVGPAAALGRVPSTDLEHSAAGFSGMPPSTHRAALAQSL